MSKNIGLIIAIEREMQSFLAYGKGTEEISVCNKKVYKTVIGGKNVYAVKSGYGMIDASASTQLLISSFDCEVIFNFGVTGALTRDLRVEDLFLVKKCRNYQYDVSPIDPVKKNQYEEFPDEFIPLDEELYRKATAIAPDLKEGIDATGDRFVEQAKDKDELASLGCNICDMELAAIARTSYLCGVKCLSVKCISDTYDGNGGDFNTNVRRSAGKAFEILLKIMKEIDV